MAKKVTPKNALFNFDPATMELDDMCRVRKKVRFNTFNPEDYIDPDLPDGRLVGDWFSMLSHELHEWYKNPTDREVIEWEVEMNIVWYTTTVMGRLRDRIGPNFMLFFELHEAIFCNKNYREAFYAYEKIKFVLDYPHRDPEGTGKKKKSRDAESIKIDELICEYGKGLTDKNLAVLLSEKLGQKIGEDVIRNRKSRLRRKFEL